MKTFTYKKALNKLLVGSFAVLITVAGAAVSAQAQKVRRIKTVNPVVKPRIQDHVIPLPLPSPVDISLRKALYANGMEKTAVDPGNRYGTPSTTLVLSPADASHCNANTCDFNLGFFLMRNKGFGQQLNTLATISGGLTQPNNVIGFQPGVASTSLVLPVRLAPGSTQLTVQLKKYLAGEEANASNNSFKVNVVFNR